MYKLRVSVLGQLPTKGHNFPLYARGQSHALCDLRSYPQWALPVQAKAVRVLAGINRASPSRFRWTPHRKKGLVSSFTKEDSATLLVTLRIVPTVGNACNMQSR